MAPGTPAQLGGVLEVLPRHPQVGTGWWHHEVLCGWAWLVEHRPELWAGEAVPGRATLYQVVPSHLVPCPPATAAAEQPASHPGNAPCAHSTLNVLFGESAVVSRD